MWSLVARGGLRRLGKESRERGPSGSSGSSPPSLVGGLPAYPGAGRRRRESNPVFPGTDPRRRSSGELPERLNGPVSKTGVPARAPGVQIPHSPPFFASRGPALSLEGPHPSRPFRCGEVSERLKEHAWKACVRETVPGVRIPPSPPHSPPPQPSENLEPSPHSREDAIFLHGASSAR